MLPINFTASPGEKPEMEAVMREIGQWCKSHRALSAIDPRRIANDIDVAPEVLVQALWSLVERGYLKQVYKFETPAGYLLEDEYESYLDVPPELQDRYDNAVHRSEGTIIPVYRGA